MVRHHRALWLGCAKNAPELNCSTGLLEGAMVSSVAGTTSTMSSLWNASLYFGVPIKKRQTKRPHVHTHICSHVRTHPHTHMHRYKDAHASICLPLRTPEHMLACTVCLRIHVFNYAHLHQGQHLCVQIHTHAYVHASTPPDACALPCRASLASLTACIWWELRLPQARTTDPSFTA